MFLSYLLSDIVVVCFFFFFKTWIFCSWYCQVRWGVACSKLVKDHRRRLLKNLHHLVNLDVALLRGVTSSEIKLREFSVVFNLKWTLVALCCLSPCRAQHIRLHSSVFFGIGFAFPLCSPFFGHMLSIMRGSTGRQNKIVVCLKISLGHCAISYSP